ncbi:hypothetical protein HKX48_003828 [Thoreauomyces humboldtii]|nr:hypothetical protein HKX48_003828 [Thoreauomyces humboldtii]
MTGTTFKQLTPIYSFQSPFSTTVRALNDYGHEEDASNGGYVNRVTLAGRLARDPEFKEYGQGDSTFSTWRFTVVTEEIFKKRSGEEGKSLLFHNVDYSGKDMPDGAVKGAMISLEGAIRYWKNKDGNLRTTIRVPSSHTIAVGDAPSEHDQSHFDDRDSRQ